MWPFSKPTKMAELSVREIVVTTIRNHPPDCEFFGGRDAAAEAAIAAIGDIFGLSEEDLINRIEAAIKAQESYCPHEGIDRRKAA